MITSEDIFNKIVSCTYKCDNSERNLVNVYIKQELDAVRIISNEIYTEMAITVSELQAKVYAYEKIIANSNFKPMLLANKSEEQHES